MANASTDLRPHPFAKLYLAYLLIAPLGATTMAMVTYTGPADFVLALMWLGGAVAIAIYASFVGTYLVAPKTWWRAALAILDGPLWLVLAILLLHGWEVLDLTTWFFVAESIGIYLAIAIVAVRKAPFGAGTSIAIMVGCIIVVCYTCGWALFPKLAHDGRAALMFVVGIAQSTFAAYWVVDRDQPVRDTDTGGFLVLVAIGLMQVGLGIGAILRFVVLR